VLILLSVYKVRGVEATFRYGLYIIENEGGLIAGGGGFELQARIDST